MSTPRTPAPERKIVITAGTVRAEAALDGSRTAAAIWEALPITVKGDTWGEEIYFDIGKTLPAEDPKAEPPRVRSGPRVR